MLPACIRGRWLNQLVKLFVQKQHLGTFHGGTYKNYCLVRKKMKNEWKWMCENVVLPIDQISFWFALYFFYCLLKQVQHFFIWNKSTEFHDLGQFFAFIGAGLNFCSQQITGTKVAKTELFHNFRTLCTFAAARTSQDPNNWNIISASLWQKGKWKKIIISECFRWNSLQIWPFSLVATDSVLNSIQAGF